MTIRILLEGERALSWNTFYKQGFWKKRYDLAKEKQLLVRAAIDPDIDPFAVPVQITIRATFKDHPVDVDNVCSKTYIDGLKGFVIADDDIGYVGRVIHEVVMGKENSVLIIVEPMAIDSATNDVVQ